ncbi:MAG TPA: hypothetical protein VG538_02125 [Vicinamibacterales bacterium]|jgi:hypothetical protein|nr:hypothetical protein [Vicinamibacterales bacterium]
MPLDVNAFVRMRPYAYHLTAETNLDVIKRGGWLHSAAVLFRKTGEKGLVCWPRGDNEDVLVDGNWIRIRDQKPLQRATPLLTGGWTMGALVQAINTRVFFWPGTKERPIDYGRRHFSAYAATRSLLLRVSTKALMEANADATAEFCRYNSGAPCPFDAMHSPRGPDTFVQAPDFDGPPSKVAELVFPTAVRLPQSWEIGTLVATTAADGGNLEFTRLTSVPTRSTSDDLRGGTDDSTH